MSKDKIVLEAEDQFEISYRNHMDNMVRLLKEMTDNLMIPIRFDEYEFEMFIKRYSSGYDRMYNKHEDYLKELEIERNENK